MSFCGCSCANNPDAFYYICGEYTPKHQRKRMTDFVKQSYFAYFDAKLCDHNKPWAPHKVCKTCVENLRIWKNGKLKGLRFGVLMVWRESQNHHGDRYCCMVNVKGFNRYKKVGISRFKVRKTTSSALRKHSCACFHFTSSASWFR